MPENRISRKIVEERIEELLHTSWDLVSKRNTELKSLADEALALAKKINNKNYIGLALMEIALYECVANSNYFLSIKLCDEAFGMLRGPFKKKYAPYYHLNIGRNYHFTGDNEASQKHYLQCIQLLELKPDKNYYEKRWLAHAYYNVFILFNFIGAEFTQNEYLNKAITVYQEIDDKSGMGNCYNSYAVFYFKSGKLKDALEWLLKAYALAEADVSIPLLSIYSANIGLVYTKLNDPKTGFEYFALAQKYDAQLNSDYHVAHTSNQMGEAYIITEKYDAAVECFKRAEALFMKMGVKRSLSDMYDNISEAYALSGDHRSAFIYKKKYAESLKDVFNEEKTFAIAKARNDFELEKKDRETQLLKKKNAQIEKYAHQLEISNNELRQFAHVASHDLREPLRMVNSYVSLLKRRLNEKLTDDEMEYMHFITEGTQTMHALIGDLLTLSAITYEKSVTAVDLNSVMKKVTGTLSAQIQEKNASIQYPVLPVLKSDETHMLQLFQNLVSNAIKYNLSETPEVTISFTLTGKKYQFIVGDNGIGIPAEFRKKIFLIFQRLHSRDEFSGTGIGLAICKKIIDQSGGNIWVEQNAAGGSNFIFTLPVN